MIPACSSCPDCLTDTLPLDPQPLMQEGKSGDHRSRYRVVFECRCGRQWSARLAEVLAHYRFLDARGLFNFPPKSPSTSTEPHSLMAFVKIRLREVLSRL